MLVICNTHPHLNPVRCEHRREIIPRCQMLVRYILRYILGIVFQRLGQHQCANKSGNKCSFSITNFSLNNKVLIIPKKKKKQWRKFHWTLSDNRNSFSVCCKVVLCITPRQSSGGEIVCAPLQQYSGGEVGVCQSPRWYTKMESDSCQEGSGLPCPLHRKSREKRSA